MAENCSSLKFEDYATYFSFNGDKNGLLLRENEADMPNILQILGECYKNGPEGYPIFNWQES